MPQLQVLSLTVASDNCSIILLKISKATSFNTKYIGTTMPFICRPIRLRDIGRFHLSFMNFLSSKVMKFPVLKFSHSVLVHGYLNIKKGDSLSVTAARSRGTRQNVWLYCCLWWYSYQDFRGKSPKGIQQAMTFNNVIRAPLVFRKILTLMLCLDFLFWLNSL